jgi:hypothetical protein
VKTLNDPPVRVARGLEYSPGHPRTEATVLPGFVVFFADLRLSGLFENLCAALRLGAFALEAFTV